MIISGCVVHFSVIGAFSVDARKSRHNITQTFLCNIQQFLKNSKKDNFQMNIFDIFLIFAQNIDCWYTSEPPH